MQYFKDMIRAKVFLGSPHETFFGGVVGVVGILKEININIWHEFLLRVSLKEMRTKTRIMRHPSKFYGTFDRLGS